MNDDNDKLLPDPQVARRYSVTPMTVWRWSHDPRLGFPAAIKIRSRNYRRLGDLRRWERTRTREAA